MRWALQSGTMPTLRRWVDTGSHVLHEWTVQMPCTTPASQQAILQGTAAGVPAFRWYDRELGRVLVSNRPKDAAIIESRVTTGLGLLADEVAAFEPLVGCHGGLGGWQDRAFVLAPPELLAPSEPIVGGDHLHQHLVGILDSLGHRTHLTRTSR